MKTQKFTAEIISPDDGMDTAYITIPFDVKKVFGSKRPKVKCIFDENVTYRGLLVNITTDCHAILMRKDIRKQLGKSAGDKVQVEMELDTEPRIVEVPDTLEKEFKKNKKAQEFFDSLSFSNKNEYVKYINDARQEETRNRRLENVINKLNEGKRNLTQK